MYTSAHQIILAAEVIQAVWDQEKVRFSLDGGETVVEGTLRSFTRSEGICDSPSSTADVDSTWVRVTTVQGWERWVRFTDLVDARRESFFGIG